VVKVHCESLKIMKINENIITREAQGRSREAGSEGSVYQTVEPMNKNNIGGSISGRAGQGQQSLSGEIAGVNVVVATGKCMDLSGGDLRRWRDGVSIYPTNVEHC